MFCTKFLMQTARMLWNESHLIKKWNICHSQNKTTAKQQVQFSSVCETSRISSNESFSICFPTRKEFVRCLVMFFEVFQEVKLPVLFAAREKCNENEQKEKWNKWKQLLLKPQRCYSFAQKISFSEEKVLLNGVSTQLIISYNHFCPPWPKTPRTQQSLSFANIGSNCT